MVVHAGEAARFRKVWTTKVLPAGCLTLTPLYLNPMLIVGYLDIPGNIACTL